MRQRTVFEAVDGKAFHDAHLCKDHEERLFNVWLKENKTFLDFLGLKVDPNVTNERRAVLRDYWEWKQGGSIIVK